MVFIIDNYDSFVYNIVHFLALPEDQFRVVRNDRITVEEIRELIDRKAIDCIIISPGPMSPKNAGISNDVIRHFYKEIPILGVCLGHECIGEVFGCRIVQCGQIVHGESDDLYLSESPLYEGVGSRIKGARYHSLCIGEEGFNHRDLVVDARLKDGTIMGLRHREYPLFGVQYHPESILTGENGKVILHNFIRFSKSYNAKGD